MKVLKALLAVLTTLAVALTAILLFWQDKSAPRYIKIYENEQLLFLAKQHPGQAVKPPDRGVFILFCFYTQSFSLIALMYTPLCPSFSALTTEI